MERRQSSELLQYTADNDMINMYGMEWRDYQSGVANFVSSVDK